ncbi:MAG: hypothetical protein HYZ18_13450, partial [Pseudogulbenkiania sp.]|nr:hypothetical protein [Pseudogulbenkiania sp.]
GLRPAAFEPLFRIDELSHPLWLATGRNSDPALVDALRRCVARLKASGRLQALQRQHEQALR